VDPQFDFFVMRSSMKEMSLV